MQCEKSTISHGILAILLLTLVIFIHLSLKIRINVLSMGSESLLFDKLLTQIVMKF